MVRKLRISIVQYLNTAPLVRGFTHGPLQGKYDLSFTVPSQCADSLRTNAADIAIIPAIEVQRIPNLVILPDLSIASKERVRSLLVISKTSIREARRIALDSSSRSTQALVKILWDARPQIATPEVAADFSASLAYGLAHLPEICAEASRELALPEKELSLYLRTNIDYSLDAENLKGLNEYFAHAARLNLIPKLNALAILTSPAPAPASTTNLNLQSNSGSASAKLSV